MAKLTDDADYDAGKRLRMYQVHCQMLGAMTTNMADDFGLGAFYIVSVTTRPSCDNESRMRLRFVTAVTWRMSAKWPEWLTTKSFVTGMEKRRCRLDCASLNGSDATRLSAASPDKITHIPTTLDEQTSRRG
ncbi:unnamed protein product [Protopolystoma xenopodis]|uniref:Uncharacterized protein n=1 Tax=Protopolystoma xenopodis TaxID=117903 RepID=A0A3S5CVB1_9PLAT|nr:unnamed protein product [Protopolystoma xenopodis]